MRNKLRCVFGRASVGVILGCAAILAAGCSSTIHDQENVGGVDTLSVDAKQRMLLIGNRGGISPKRVMCTEPMPDAIVAQAAVLAGSANINNPSGISGSGGLSGGSTESAGSIGFRDQSIQMLRDGYYRLCEAYLNGALTKQQYQHMILNADTFMVVVSALQILGSNPVAPAVTISAGSVSASTTAAGAATVQTQPPGTGANAIQQVTPTATSLSPENARMAAQIVDSYLRYRRELDQNLRQDARHPIPSREDELQPE